MSYQHSLINPRAQPYETLKRSLELGPNAASKFDILNTHVRNTVVMPGELIILGDGSTPSSTSEEAFLMAKARDIHLNLAGGSAGFIHENFQAISAALGYTALGIGTSSAAWGKRLNEIQETLVDIESLYQKSLGNNSILSRNEFITRRRVMFDLLDRQLKGFAGLGSGLKNTNGIRNMLGLSTNSYMRHGEVAGYADKIAKVSKAARYMKAGGHLGIALNVVASGLAIHQACSVGREEECTEAKYIEGGRLAGSLVVGVPGGYVGTYLAMGACVVAFGIVSGGLGMFACIIIGGGLGGYTGGLLGAYWGEAAGRYLYK